MPFQQHKTSTRQEQQKSWVVVIAFVLAAIAVLSLAYDRQPDAAQEPVDARPIAAADGAIKHMT